jgi:glycosyltransferase involved in cell wall biosynthesis
MRLFAFPLRLKAPNGYWDQLYGEMQRQRPGMKMYHAAWGALFASFGRRNIVHIHWPSQLYSSRYAALAWVRFALRASIVWCARLRGDRVVWTLHNYHDHTLAYPWLESIAQSFLAHASHAVIVHSPAGREYLRMRWGRRHGAFVIAHGNYINFHGPRLAHPDRSLQRTLGIDVASKVFLAIGSIRPYKGLERLIEIFNGFPQTVKLVIAGSASWNHYVQSLRRQANQENIKIIPGLIPGDDLPRYFSLGICSVYAFTEILTSGSVILSLSYGVPAIVPAQGDMPYVVKGEVNGYTYATTDQLKRCIETVLRLPQDGIAKLQQGALQSVASLNYQTIAQQTLNAYGL